MTRKALAAAAVILSSGVAFAHHGAAAYDRETTISLDATIVEFVWENPHALIRFEARRGTGSGDLWLAETAGLVILARAGWRRDTLAPGDRCRIVGYRAKNGSHTMILERVSLDDGRVLGNYIP